MGRAAFLLRQLSALLCIGKGPGDPGRSPYNLLRCLQFQIIRRNASLQPSSPPQRWLKAPCFSPAPEGQGNGKGVGAKLPTTTAANSTECTKRGRAPKAAAAALLAFNSQAPRKAGGPGPGRQGAAGHHRKAPQQNNRMHFRQRANGTHRGVGRKAASTRQAV